MSDRPMIDTPVSPSEPTPADEAHLRDTVHQAVAEAVEQENGESEEGDAGYPYEATGVTVLGPQVFVDAEGDVICWRGENYYRDPILNPEQDRRSMALHQARTLLEARRPSGVLAAGWTPKPKDLIRVATWILDGNADL